MKYLVAAVKDNLTNKYLQPIFLELEHGEEAAKRIFSLQINTDKIWKNNPSDFTLHDLGVFDDETGVFDSRFKVKEICNGRSVLRKEET